MSKSSESASKDEAPSGLPPELRFLKRLVTVLTAVMILGLVTIVALLVIRLGQPAAPLPALPAAVVLPAGEVAGAVTFGPGFSVVVTQSGRVLVYSADGALRQDVRP